MAVRVNGELIPDERFHRAFLEISGGRSPEQVTPHDLEHLRQQAQAKVLRTVLLTQLAAAERITATPQEAEEERRIAWGSSANQSCGTGITDDMVERILVRKAERYLARHVPRPERREVEAVYRANPAAFTQPDRWQVSHIVKLAETEAERAEARQTLETAAAELKCGKGFAAVADRYSDCPGNGGTLGWLIRGSMVAEFEQHVYSLPRRSISDIFATPFGLHIATVTDIKPAGLQPLEDVRALLARQIYEDRKQQVIDQAVSNLYSRARLEIVDAVERSVAAGEVTA